MSVADKKKLRTEMGWSTADRIVVRGMDLPGEILGTLNLGDMAFLELTGRTPGAKESRLFNAMVVTLVEHGITPSALATRLTVPRLFEIARESDYYGKYVELVQLIQAEAERAAKKSLPLNATGAIAAIGCEMGFDWKVLRGLGVMARAVGLVGHILEESRAPMAQEIWHRVEEEATEHLRPRAK